MAFTWRMENVDKKSGHINQQNKMENINLNTHKKHTMNATKQFVLENHRDIYFQRQNAMLIFQMSK
jgi:hypothetical protein